MDLMAYSGKILSFQRYSFGQTFLRQVGIMYWLKVIMLLSRKKRIFFLCNEPINDHWKKKFKNSTICGNNEKLMDF